MSITHVTPREMELQAEVARLTEREAFHQHQRDLNTAAYAAMTRERDELRVELATLKASKPPRLSPEEVADLAAAIMNQPLPMSVFGEVYPLNLKAQP